MYNVENWAPGKNASAVPNASDLKSTYEDFASKAPGKFGGKGPAMIDLSNKPEEKIIYIKLVLRDIIDNTPKQVTIIKVKEPSTGGNVYIEKSTADPGNYDASETDWDYKEDIQTPNDPQDVHKWSEVARTSEARACSPF